MVRIFISIWAYAETQQLWCVPTDGGEAALVADFGSKHITMYF